MFCQLPNSNLAPSQGWLFRVRMSKEAEEVKGLMDADGYKEYLKSQEEDQQ